MSQVFDSSVQFFKLDPAQVCRRTRAGFRVDCPNKLMLVRSYQLVPYADTAGLTLLHCLWDLVLRRSSWSSKTR